MLCPLCKSEQHTVIDSGRNRSGPSHVWRKRLCKTCKTRFHTYEIIAPVDTSVLDIQRSLQNLSSIATVKSKLRKLIDEL